MVHRMITDKWRKAISANSEQAARLYLGFSDDVSRIDEDNKCLSLSTLFFVTKFQLDFTRIGESTYFKAKDAFESYIQSSPELVDSDKMLS